MSVGMVLAEGGAIYLREDLGVRAPHSPRSSFKYELHYHETTGFLSLGIY